MKTRGFTLIEVLVSVTILTVLVLLLSTAFNHAIRMVHSAENNAEQLASSRAALDFMARDLSASLISDLTPFSITESSVQTIYGRPAPKLSFFSKMPFSTASTRREVYPVKYYLAETYDGTNQLQNSFTLYRVWVGQGEMDEVRDSLGSTNWIAQGEQSGDGFDDLGVALAKHVTRFDVVACCDGTTQADFVAATNRLHFIDLSVGVIASETAQQAELLDGAELLYFIEQHEQIFARRIWITAHDAHTYFAH